MKDFNLILSTARDFERQAQCELWFNLIALGDEHPVIEQTGIQGLLLAKTSIEPRSLIKHLQEIINTKDEHYVQFLMKIYPIDVVVESELIKIKAAAQSLVKRHPLCQNMNSLFRITIRKRHTTLTTEAIISAIADDMEHKVSLQKYDWNLQVEIVGEYTGLAVIQDVDIFRPLSEDNVTPTQSLEHIID